MKCSEEVTYFKCRKTGHYANECPAKKETRFKCDEKGHFKKDFPMKEGTTKTNVSPKLKARAYHMIFDEEARGHEFGAACVGVLEGRK